MLNELCETEVNLTRAQLNQAELRLADLVSYRCFWRRQRILLLIEF